MPTGCPVETEKQRSDIKLIRITNVQELIESQRNATIDQLFFPWLESELRMLWEHLGRGECLNDFNLTEHGPLWVATVEDRTRNWNSLTSQMGVYEPEFIERYFFPAQKIAFRSGFMATNDHMPLFFALAEQLHPKVAKRLTQGSEESSLPSATNEPAPF